MKRILSLVLALVIVLGTMPMAFAEVEGNTEADQTAGEMLQAAGFVEGGDNGDLMEEKSLTRAELCVLVAELNGVKEMAKAYTMPANFSDVQDADWYSPYVAYAVNEGWFNGVGDGKFAPQGEVTPQMLATVMMRALGYTPNWETAISEAAAINLTVDAEAETMNRGEAFVTLWQTVNTPKKDSDVKLGVELGKLEEEAEDVAGDLVATIDEAKAIANNLVEVTFTEDVDAAAGVAANYTIVEKDDATKELAIVAADVEGDDVVVLETEAMTAGKAYTVIAGESKANYAGVKKETSAPKVDSVKGSDTGTVKVEFDMMLDKATSEDVANYSIDKEGTVVAASLNDDRDTVTLTVEGITTTASRKLTIENVTNTDGIVIKKVTRPFSPQKDVSTPKLDDVTASKKNNVEILVDFDDDHGVDKATAEDVANYSIDGLEIISAEATYQDEDKQDEYYDRVILTTSEQKSSTNYTLKVLYMVDGSVSKNATTKVLDEKFRAGSADDDEPKVKTVDEKTFTEIHVTFDEANALDAATALDISNYNFEDNELDVLSVEFKDEDDNGNTYDGADGTVATGYDPDEITVILTVSEMEDGESYKLIINNIADNFGNTMDSAEKDTVRAPSEVKTYSIVDTVKVDDLETLTIKFDEPVRETGAEDPTNYVIDGGIGVAKDADLKSDDKTVELTVPSLTANKTYEITVNNVENYWGYITEDSTKMFVAVTDEDDTDKPEIADVDFDDKGILSITFDEAMDPSVVGTASVKVNVNKSTATAYDPTADITLTATAMADEDETIIYDASSSAGLANGKEYYIIGFTSAVTDKADNLVDYDADDDDFVTDDDAFDSDDDAVVCDGLNQEDGRTIYATFSERVLVNDPVGGTAQIKSSNVVYTFDMELDDEDDQLVELTLVGSNSFDDEEELLKFDFNSIFAGSVTDVIGRAIKSETIEIEVDNDDESAPTVDDIVLVDRTTIKVYFDEPLRDAGKFKIENIDDDDDFYPVVTGFDVGEDYVKLVISSSSDYLTSDNSYELTMTRAPEDLAGNDFEDYKDYEYQFIGTDLKPEEDFMAVRVLNATKLAVTNDDDYSAAEAAGMEFESPTISTYAISSAKAPEVVDDEVVIYLNPQFAVTDDESYTVTDTVADPDIESQSFKGNLETETVASTTGAGTTTFTVEFSSLKKEDDYSYGAGFVNVNGANDPSVALTVTPSTSDAYTFDITGATFSAGDKIVLFVFDADRTAGDSFVVGSDIVEYVSPVMTVK